MQVIQLSDYRKPPPPPQPRQKRKSQYMPFFNKKRRCTWDVTPTGDYSADFKTGQDFALNFLLLSCRKSSQKRFGLVRAALGEMVVRRSTAS
jgi:hypothetical protein